MGPQQKPQVTLIVGEKLTEFLIDIGATYSVKGASQVVLIGKNLSASAEDIRDMGSVPGLGRSPGGGNGNPL